MALNRKIAELNVFDLETVGRMTGRKHVVELWFAADPERERIYILAGDREAADWVRNVRVQPSVRAYLGDRWRSGQAHWIEGEADEPLARRLLAAKYQGWREGLPFKAWARNSLPVAIDLKG